MLHNIPPNLKNQLCRLISLIQVNLWDKYNEIVSGCFECFVNLFDERRIKKVTSPRFPLRPAGTLAGARGGHWAREGEQRSESGAQCEGQPRSSDEARPRESRSAAGPLPGRLQGDRQAAVASPPPGAGGGLGLEPDLRGNAEGELLPGCAFLLTLLCCYWR